MIRPTKIFIENLPFVEDDSNNKRFYSDPCIGFVTVHLFQNVQFILISLDIQAIISQPLATRNSVFSTTNSIEDTALVEKYSA